MKMALLDKWDLNRDGKIDKTELSMILMQQNRMCEDDEGTSTADIDADIEEEEEDEGEEEASGSLEDM